MPPGGNPSVRPVPSIQSRILMNTACRTRTNRHANRRNRRGEDLHPYPTWDSLDEIFGLTTSCSNLPERSASCVRQTRRNPQNLRWIGARLISYCSSLQVQCRWIAPIVRLRGGLLLVTEQPPMGVCCVEKVDIAPFERASRWCDWGERSPCVIVVRTSYCTDSLCKGQ